ncbi:MAG: squalene synthase HpnC [Rhodospirillaceae bacterium]|nr:squalene synthase HpnC [Rhodospirillaceae bacterium]
MNDLATVVETPSGKDAAYENFPVGSWLLPAHLRPHIAAYYRFARAIDDIADNPDLPADEKIARLDGFQAAILGKDAATEGFETGHAMRSSLLATDVSAQHCLDLIDAFKQDAVKNRYDDWDDLIGYCIRSAAPVGRYLLDLHGGSEDGYGPSDALCNALQVINHLQDCQDDFQTMDRVYLPEKWMREAGMEVSALAAGTASAAVRQVIDRTLDATEGLMDEAWRLPGGLKSRRLAMESTVILRIAERLIELLRAGDPLSGRIELQKHGYLWQCLCGALPVALGVRPPGRPGGRKNVGGRA